MESIWFFVKTSVKGGMLFFLPIVFIVMVVEKAISLSTLIITPLAEKFGIENFAGKATIGLLIVFSILTVCFLGGLLMRIKLFGELNQKLDKTLLKLIPSYGKLKSNAIDENKK